MYMDYGALGGLETPWDNNGAYSYSMDRSRGQNRAREENN